MSGYFTHGIADVQWSPDGPDEGIGDATSDELKAVQRKLRELGYVETGKADGQWGTKTRAAVLA
ncbi:MAG TPA: peptidoglycan-binding protein, partial [Campylobacterales bacterium]|nr:peptidoglycan-binding protein [Campylobacterales bacterium]